MMKAMVYRGFGAAADVLVLEELPTPEPLAGEVRVRLKASGVNPSDVKARAGLRGGEMPYPAIVPHSDGAGIIDAVGEGVDRARIGESVWVWNGQWGRPYGTAAEYVTLPAEQAVVMPEGLSFEAGAVLGIPGLTACHCVFGNGDVAGKTVLVSGGGGMVGYLAVQMAKAGGARVLATVGNDVDRDRVERAGADYVFSYRSPELADEILSVTNGVPVDSVIEVEFGRNIETNTRIIKEHGRIVSYGSAQVKTPALPYSALMFKAVTIELVLVYLLTREQRMAAIRRLSGLLESGRVTIPLHAPFRLDEIASAHQVVEQGERSGAVILSIQEA